MDNLLYSYPHKIYEAIFVSRKNRFIAEVEIEGQIELVHVKNTGRMVELLVPGTMCYVQYVNKESRKTKYDLIAVKHGDILVNLDSQIANVLGEKIIQEKLISGFEDQHVIKREVKLGESRIDILVKNQLDEHHYIEVKGVNLVKNGLALFPDAPTIRGAKHLLELADYTREGGRSTVLFILMRSDAQQFSPHKEMDIKFAEAYLLAKQSGVDIRAVSIKVEKDKLYFDSEIMVL